MALACRAGRRRSVAICLAAGVASMLLIVLAVVAGPYPSVLTEPPPRATRPLTPEEVKQATDKL